MSTEVDSLLKLLAVKPTDEAGVFEGSASHEDHVRAFGGQLIGQALAALTRSSAEDRPLHSMHGYFLRPTRVDQPITYANRELRQGRSFTHRGLEATQGDKVVFVAQAAFHLGEDGRSHSQPPPDVPAPDDCVPFEERYRGRGSPEDMGRWFHRVAPFEIRPASDSAFELTTETSSAFWVRLRGSLDGVDCPPAALHAGVLGYLSDLAILDPILMTHGAKWTDAPVIGASLDHAVWVHRPFDVTDWLLFNHISPASHGGRGLATGGAWDINGNLVASLAQEALLRPPGPRP